jgi:hypothetical protein
MRKGTIVKKFSMREAWDMAVEDQAAKDAAKAEAKAAKRAEQEKAGKGPSAWQKIMDAADQQNAAAKKWGKYDVEFADARIKAGTVTVGHRTINPANTQIELVQGGQVQRMTATRVLGGAAIGAVTFGAGAVGALIGGMSKKQKAGAWVFIIEAGKKPVQLPVKPKQQADAYQFVNNFQALQAEMAS